jgi:hypothetical protein
VHEALDNLRLLSSWPGSTAQAQGLGAAPDCSPGLPPQIPSAGTCYGDLGKTIVIQLDASSVSADSDKTGGERGTFNRWLNYGGPFLGTSASEPGDQG